MNIPVTVFIHEKERMLGAMVKALAFEAGGPSSVRGVSHYKLSATSHYTFTFTSDRKAQEFREAVSKYFPGYLVRVVNEPKT
jgi:hypothetical protein